jgi:hypothetical protein
MPNSIEANIGVSVKLQLNFKNIDTIVKLLSSDAQLIIYGLDKPIDLDCKCNDNKQPYFDNRILQKLYKLNNEEEFIEYSSKIAEIRGDKKVLRKKIEYVNFEDEQEVNDYLDFFDNYDNIEDDTEDNAEEKLRIRFEQSKIKQKYINCDLNKTKISFLFYVNLLNYDVRINTKKENDTDFETISNLTEFINIIEKAKQFFSHFGIDNKNLSIFNYNTSEEY